MMKGAITFSNNEKVIISDGQLLVPYRIYNTDDGDIISMFPSYEVWNHTHDGLIPSITEFLCKCEYFRLLDSCDKLYKVSAIVSVENL